MGKRLTTIYHLFKRKGAAGGSPLRSVYPNRLFRYPKAHINFIESMDRIRMHETETISAVGIDFPRYVIIAMDRKRRLGGRVYCLSCN